MRSPDMGTAPRVLVTPSFHILEAWYEPGAPPLSQDLTIVRSSAPHEPRAFFRLLLDEQPLEERLRKFPFVPPSSSLLLFVPREAAAPWNWHRQAGFYLDIRSRDRRAIFPQCDQKATARVVDTEALWSAYWLHKEFTNHSGELSDVKIDWLADRVIDKSRHDVERAGWKLAAARPPRSPAPPGA